VFISDISARGSRGRYRRDAREPPAVTVAIVITIYEGVVLASEQRRHDVAAGTTRARPRSAISTTNAEKVFRLSSTAPVGAVTLRSRQTSARSRSEPCSGGSQAARRTIPRSSGLETGPCRYSVKQIADRVIDLIFDEHYRPIVARGGPATVSAARWPATPRSPFSPRFGASDFDGLVRPRLNWCARPVNAA